MEYRVTDPRGVALPPSTGAGGDPAATARVAACFRETCSNGCVRGGGEIGGRDVDQFQHLLVRMANQYVNLG
jgi:hypothetical protein